MSRFAPTPEEFRQALKAERLRKQKQDEQEQPPKHDPNSERAWEAEGRPRDEGDDWHERTEEEKVAQAKANWDAQKADLHPGARLKRATTPEEMREAAEEMTEALKQSKPKRAGRVISGAEFAQAAQAQAQKAANEAITELLPPIDDGAVIMQAKIVEPPQLISGIVHKGLKMELAGASKTMKSWLQLQTWPMTQPDPERFLLSQDIFWRLVTQPEAKYDAGSLNAACDVAFAAASVYFKRLGEEKERLATLERDMLRDQLAHELANSQKAQKRRRPGGP